MNPKNNKEKPFMSSTETMDFIGVSRNKFHQMVKDGFLKAYFLKGSPKKMYVKTEDVKALFEPK